MTQLSRNPGAWRLLICLLLAGAVLAPYLQVKDHDFTTFDDDLYVTNNPMVRPGTDLGGGQVGLYLHALLQLASPDLAVSHAGLPAFRITAPRPSSH